MSNLLPAREMVECYGAPASGPLEALPVRATQLGELTVRRLLPVRGRRMIGPWCFFDRYGPLAFAEGKPMDVAPHPHIGLQTVSWLLTGELIHRDSLGSEALVRPGEVSLMTAGRGIAHTEETPGHHSGRLHGAQFWVAQPAARRGMEPEYHHLAAPPRLEWTGAHAVLFLGEWSGVRSPGRLDSPGLGAEIIVHAAAHLVLPLEPGFEYGLLLVEGDVHAEGEPLTVETLYYLGPGRAELRLASRAGARLLLVGGAPFGESIVMWWNFVARSAEEIAAARASWERDEFPAVLTYDGPRLRAPELLGRPHGA